MRRKKKKKVQITVDAKGRTNKKREALEAIARTANASLIQEMMDPYWSWRFMRSAAIQR